MRSPLGPIDDVPADVLATGDMIIDDEPGARMNVDDRDEVGDVVMLSTALEVITAALPIGGPKLEVLDPRVDVGIWRDQPCPSKMTASNPVPTDARDRTDDPLREVESGTGVLNTEPVVCWTVLRDTPRAMGVSCVTSGLSKVACELEGSISRERSLGADASRRMVSTGACTNDEGTSELTARWQLSAAEFAP